MTLTRRHVVGGALAAGALAALPKSARAQADDSTFRTMPSTGQRIPAVGLGTWITFNVGRDPVLLERSTEVMRAFFAAGGGVIDSSPMYGSSQATVGHGLEALGSPGPLTATDKVWTGSAAEGPAQIEASRRQWGVPHFDILQVHNLVAWEAHLETLFEMKARGELTHVGVTTSHGRRHEEVERIMESRPIDVVQLTYNPLDRDPEERLLPLAREKGIAVVVNRPFRQGALVDRVRGAPLPAVADAVGARSWPQLLLSFILSHPAITVAIPATTNPDHMRENKEAAMLPLADAATRRRIAEAVAAL